MLRYFHHINGVCAGWAAIVECILLLVRSFILYFGIVLSGTMCTHESIYGPVLAFIDCLVHL